MHMQSIISPMKIPGLLLESKDESCDGVIVDEDGFSNNFVIRFTKLGSKLVSY